MESRANLDRKQLLRRRFSLWFFLVVVIGLSGWLIFQQKLISGLHRDIKALSKENLGLTTEVEQKNSDFQSLQRQNEALRKMQDPLVRLQTTNAIQIQRLRAQVRRLLEHEQRPIDPGTPLLGQLDRRIRKLEEENLELRIQLEGKPAVPRVGAWLGVSISDPSQLGQQQPGATVVDIVPRSPAERAHLQIGDLVVNVDGQPITGAADFKNMLAQKSGGQRFALEVVRREDKIRLEVEGADWPQ